MKPDGGKASMFPITDLPAFFVYVNPTPFVPYELVSQPDENGLEHGNLGVNSLGILSHLYS